MRFHHLANVLVLLGLFAASSYSQEEDDEKIIEEQLIIDMTSRGGGGGFKRGGGSGVGGVGKGGEVGGGFNKQDMSPPDNDISVGDFTQTSQDKADIQDIPFLKYPIYLKNNEQIGQIDDIFGSPGDYYVTIKLSDIVKLKNFKQGDKLFIDPAMLLPLKRFLPKRFGARGARRARASRVARNINGDTDGSTDGSTSGSTDGSASGSTGGNADGYTSGSTHGSSSGGIFGGIMAGFGLGGAGDAGYEGRRRRRSAMYGGGMYGPMYGYGYPYYGGYMI